MNMVVLVASLFLFYAPKIVISIYNRYYFFVSEKNNNPKLLKKQEKQLLIIYNYKIKCFYTTFIEIDDDNLF